MQQVDLLIISPDPKELLNLFIKNTCYHEIRVCMLAGISKRWAFDRTVPTHTSEVSNDSSSATYHVKHQEIRSPSLSLSKLSCLKRTRFTLHLLKTSRQKTCFLQDKKELELALLLSGGQLQPGHTNSKSSVCGKPGQRETISQLISAERSSVLVKIFYTPCSC